MTTRILINNLNNRINNLQGQINENEESALQNPATEPLNMNSFGINNVASLSGTGVALSGISTIDGAGVSLSGINTLSGNSTNPITLLSNVDLNLFVFFSFLQPFIFLVFDALFINQIKTNQLLNLIDHRFYALYCKTSLLI